MYERPKRDRVVSTFWLSDRNREAGKQPIMHVFGPYTLSQARRTKKRLDDEELPEPGLSYAAVCRVSDVVDGELLRVVDMETESEGLQPVEGGRD